MNEIVAVLMFLILAFGLGIAALLAYGIEALIVRYSARKRNRMPGRIRALNG